MSNKVQIGIISLKDKNRHYSKKIKLFKQTIFLIMGMKLTRIIIRRIQINKINKEFRGNKN